MKIVIINICIFLPQGVWDKDTIFQGAADLCIDYKVCALDGEPQPEWKIENYYRKEPLQVCLLAN